MTRRFLLAALVLAAPVAAQETAASVAAKFHREFAQSDADRNGTLSRAEVAARIGGMTSTAHPLTPVQKRRLAELWFARADADRDGKVSEPEAQTLLARTFQRYDVDRDGRLGTGERGAARRGVTGR